jgi:hypothetical protein
MFKIIFSLVHIVHSHFELVPTVAAKNIPVSTAYLPHTLIALHIDLWRTNDYQQHWQRLLDVYLVGALSNLPQCC